MGTVAVAILSIGVSPTASLRALPSTMAQSSTTWWSSSPSALIVRSNCAYLASVSVMCLRKPMSVETSNAPSPSTSRLTETLVSLVLRSIFEVLGVMSSRRWPRW